MSNLKPADFRKELVKLMPGYDWTTHKSTAPEIMIEATGIKSSGFNRLSTLHVVKRKSPEGETNYRVRSSGFGKKAPWLHSATDRTLARALRRLQSHYEEQAALYSGHACALQSAHPTKQSKSRGES